MENSSPCLSVKQERLTFLTRLKSIYENAKGGICFAYPVPEIPIVFRLQAVSRSFSSKAAAVGGKGHANAHTRVLTGKGIACDQFAGSIQAFNHLALTIEHLAVVVDLNTGNGAEGTQGDLFNVERCGFHLGGIIGSQLVLKGRNCLARVGSLIIRINGLLVSYCFT